MDWTGSPANPCAEALTFNEAVSEVGLSGDKVKGAHKARALIQ